MRTFIIMIFIAKACSDQTGYIYQPVSYSNSGLSFNPGANAGMNYKAPANTYSAPANSGPSYSRSSYSTPSYNAPSYIAPTYSASSDSAPSYVTPSFSVSSKAAPSYSAPSYSAPAYSASSYTTPPYKAPSFTDPSNRAPAEFHKEFYTFSAPESEFEDPDDIQNIIGRVKLGFRVIFIKGPENKGFEDVALALAQQAAQQQTAIYVLNKQPDIADFANKFNDISKNANGKPDVHFVKYRTPEDATNAQRAIQSEYEAFGGNSQSINGGAAPVINFASQAPIPTATAQQPQSTYLPSPVYRFRL